MHIHLHPQELKLRLFSTLYEDGLAAPAFESPILALKTLRQKTRAFPLAATKVDQALTFSARSFLLRTRLHP